MINIDRITTDSWTVAFPCDWEDKSKDDSLYLESPDGAKGLYITLWRMGPDEHRSPSELVDSFLAVELNTLLDGSDDRELIGKSIESAEDSVICVWDTLSLNNLYRVAGKIHARGEYVLRATFHDYDCETYEDSEDF
jgi:hypothetical protein